MLLDYAAQMKCLTQRRVITTAITLSHLPTDIHHFVLHFSHNAQQLLYTISEELRAIGTRKHAKRKAKKRLDRTQQQLLKATQLIQQGQQMVGRVRTDDEEDGDLEEEQDAVETVTEEGGEDATAAEDGADECSTGQSAPGAPNLDALTEQIRQLKEQMEQLARMQSVASGASSQDDDEDEVDEEYGADSPAAVDIPIAPPMMPFGAIRSSSSSSSSFSSSFACIPIASPMLAGDIPMAPPLIAAPVIPMAPPLSPPAAPTASIPTAPPLDASASSFLTVPSAPPTAPAFTLPSLPRPPAILTLSRTALTPLSPNRPSSTPAVAAAAPAVYTRNIPGASELSHTDLIKVAAAIKLRRTNVPRSPGGTPAKRLGDCGNGSGGGSSGGGGMGSGGLGEALRRKFQNVNGGGRSSGMSGLGLGVVMGAGSGRRSWGEKDKENEWSTD